MAGIINEFIDVLNNEADIYDSLICVALNKKEAIVKNDIENLRKITAEENSVIGKLQKLEKTRISLLADIAIVINEKESNITLTSLANIIKEQKESEELNSIAVRLRKSLGDLKELNDMNNSLIQNALDYIDFSMNVMRSSLSDQPSVYTAKGQEMNFSASFVDKKN